MEKSKVIVTPMSTLCNINKDKSGKRFEEINYRSIIGSLIYLNASRPNIMFVVYMYACFQSSQKELHLSAVKRVMRYLSNTQQMGFGTPWKS